MCDNFVSLKEYIAKYFFGCFEQTILLFVIIACAYYFKDVFLGPPLRSGGGALFLCIGIKKAPQTIEMLFVFIFV